MRPIVRGKETQLDRAIYYWMNKLRTDPAELEEALTLFSTDFDSQDEPDAAVNAIIELQKLKNEQQHALEWSEALNLAAKTHCDDIGPVGLTGHFGTDQSSPFDRIVKFGKPGWWRGENLAFHTEEFPLDEAKVDDMAKKIVFKMFIDAGIAGRPNRSRILNPEFNLVGVYSCPHRDQSMTVIDFTSSMEANDMTQ